MNIRLFLISLLLFFLTLLGFWALRQAVFYYHDWERKLNLEDIQKALERFKIKFGQYPPLNEEEFCGLINNPQNPHNFIHVKNKSNFFKRIKCASHYL